MNSGDDTAFYLSKGYSVVAIEAIPELVASAHKRFRKAIQTGKLVILNVAIAEKAGKRDFWVCEQISAWSSFDKTIAGREGSKCRRIKVKTRRFRDILGKFGTPCYLKIDIEGADGFCLADLDNDNLPTFISVETECGERDVPLTARRYLATLNQLRELGYSRFKLVNQNTLVPVSRSNLNRVVDPRYLASARAETERKSKWSFPLGASGPWGNGIIGPWMDFAEALDVYCTCRELLFRKWNEPWYSFWFDWHATRPGL